MIAKAKKQSTLLADLDALDEQLKLSPDDGKVHVLAEPSATLPLWRRVDRQYWWNEWLSKPLLDAGVRPAFVMNALSWLIARSSIHSFCQSCRATFR